MKAKDIASIAAGLNISPTETQNHSVSPNFGDCSPSCPKCGGIGYLRFDVPVGHPKFGRLERCPRAHALAVEKSLQANEIDPRLGLTVDELVTAMGTDKSIADVAKEKGVDVVVIVDAAVAERAEQLNSLVADGRITQEKADTMLANLKEQVQKQLESKIASGCGDCESYRQGFPRGGFRGVPPSDNETDDTTQGTSTWGSLPGTLSRGSY